MSNGITTRFATGSLMHLNLIAASPGAGLAADHLARQADITPDEAAARLRKGTGQLTGDMHPAEAARLASVLRVLGVQVTMEPSAGIALPAKAVEPRLDLSLQPAPGSDVVTLADRVANALDRPPATVAADLLCPGGLVLCNLPATDCASRQRQFRRIRGLVVTVSDPAVAIHDLFAAGRSSDLAAQRDLGRHLRLLGLAACRFSGALAEGLDHATAQHLTERFATAGVLAVNRAFQRFDLFLTGTGEVAPLDLADFLLTRTDLAGVRIDAISPLEPVRIEAGLTHAAARQFMADYRAIGLDTCARLSRPAGPGTAAW